MYSGRKNGAKTLKNHESSCEVPVVKNILGFDSRLECE